VSTKPEIEFPGGPPPSDLLIKDLVVGEGPEAKPGDSVDVHYLGVEFDTGEEFDSSWNRGESISFPLRGLIQGWQDGIPGMRVGGRRQLVIPPDLAYGPAGAGHRLSGKTLIFVIDLLGVRERRSQRRERPFFDPRANHGRQLARTTPPFQWRRRGADDGF
jgi:peptidylprolyl isomerase